MVDIGIAGLVLTLLLSSSALGLFLQAVLREGHRGRETTDAIRLIIGILVTFTALVLGLVTGAVKTSHDLFDARLRGLAGDVIELDLRLREYGEAADTMRTTLRTYVAAAIADTWPDEPRPAGDYPTFRPTGSFEREELGAVLFDLDTAIRRLEPTDDFHRKLAEHIASRMTDLLQQRWLLAVTPQDGRLAHDDLHRLRIDFAAQHHRLCGAGDVRRVHFVRHLPDPGSGQAARRPDQGVERADA
jgi:hypothetical protein